MSKKTTPFGKEGYTFAQVPIWLVCDPEVSDGAFRLMVYLSWRQGKNAGAWPSIARMARDLRLSTSAVKRRIQALEEKAYLVVTRRQGYTSLYTIVADPNQASEAFTPRSEGGGVRSDTSVRSELGGVSEVTPRTIELNYRNELENGTEDNTKFWQTVLDDLQRQMTTATFDAWLRGTQALSRNNGTLVVAVNNARAKEWLEGRLLSTIKRVADRHAGQALEVSFIVPDDKAQP